MKHTRVPAIRLTFVGLAAIAAAAVPVGAAVAATDDTGPPPEVEIVTSLFYYVARNETIDELEQATDPLAYERRTFPRPPYRLEHMFVSVGSPGAMSTDPTIEVLRRSAVMASPGTNVPVPREKLLALIDAAKRADGIGPDQAPR
ncbi:MAG: hypothetical protein ACRBI6_05320 [Acidimicrobiales bacterium]